MGKSIFIRKGGGGGQLGVGKSTEEARYWSKSRPMFMANLA